MALRGQSSVEYLMITTFLLLVVSIIFAYATSNYQQASDTSLAKSALSRIVNIADQTYALGEGSQLFIEVEIPPNLTEVRVDFVCKDDYRTLGGNECMVVDPEPDCCEGWLDPLTKKICNDPKDPTDVPIAVDIAARTPEYCFNHWIPLRNTLSIKRSYLVLAQQNAAGITEYFKQSHGILDVDEETKNALRTAGTYVLVIDWMSDNGKIKIRLAS